MAYVKTTWVDEVTPTSAANLNHLEQGVADANAPLVARAAINQSADFDVAGLDGDADYGYEIVAVGRMSTSNALIMRPNGDAGATYAGIYDQTFRAASSVVTNSIGITSGAPDNGLMLASSPGSTPYYIASRATFHAKSQAGAYGRVFNSSYSTKSEVVTGESLVESVTEWWNPTPSSTVLNKLTFTFGGGTFNGHITVRRI